MCKLADLRELDVIEEHDPGWFTVSSYTLVFSGRRGFLDEVSHSQATSFGPELYDGKQAHRCNNRWQEFSDFYSAERHLDEEPDEDPKILRWFGVQ